MNNFSKQILIGLAALAAVAYLGLQLSLNIGTMIDIDYATYATANDDITTDAYFFREETVLTSQSEVQTHIFTRTAKKSRSDRMLLRSTLLRLTRVFRQR